MYSFVKRNEAVGYVYEGVEAIEKSMSWKGGTQKFILSLWKRCQVHLVSFGFYAPQSLLKAILGIFSGGWNS